MRGIHLRLLPDVLRPVSQKHAGRPIHAITDIEAKLGVWGPYIREHYPSFDFVTDYRCLSLRALEGFSFDELCKMDYSGIYQMDRTVTDVFEKKPVHNVVKKIRNSMWRWGVGTGDWNEIVEAYDRIRNFSFSDEFHVRLDHATYHNECGWSKYARVFIDGAFAYLIYHRGVHVMTIGFSVMEHRRILIQQVQSARKTGNRYLYRLPKNRLEYVIECFEKSFPGYRLYLIDGRRLVDKTRKQYEEGLERAREWADDAKIDEFTSKIAHLDADRERLIAFYADAGRFSFHRPSIKVNNLLHRRVLYTKVGSRIAIAA